MNAPLFGNQPPRRSEVRERRFSLLALVDTLLGWTLGLACLTISLYAVGRVVLFFVPSFFDWIKL